MSNKASMTGPRRSAVAGAALVVAAALTAATWLLAAGLIPITVTELVRLLRDTVIRPPRRDLAHRLNSPARRRRHQHRARQTHQRWNTYPETTP
jgi:hypothetical protein